MPPRSGFLAATACTLVFLTACGGGPPTEPVAAPTAEQPAAEEPTASKKPGRPSENAAQPKKTAPTSPAGATAPMRPVGPAPTKKPKPDSKPDPKPDPKPSSAPTTKPAPTQPPPADVPAGDMSAVEMKVLEITNAERAKEGCPALKPNDKLALAARRHSTDMAVNKYFSHTSQDGSSPWDRIKRAGYMNPGAENIAAGYPTAEAVMKGWMDSPGHRANILNCKLKALGVGEHQKYWTQNFGWD